jgi:hypothetical protein
LALRLDGFPPLLIAPQPFWKMERNNLIASSPSTGLPSAKPRRVQVFLLGTGKKQGFAF